MLRIHRGYITKNPHLIIICWPRASETIGTPCCRQARHLRLKEQLTSPNSETNLGKCEHPWLKLRWTGSTTQESQSSKLHSFHNIRVWKSALWVLYLSLRWYKILRSESTVRFLLVVLGFSISGSWLPCNGIHRQSNCPTQAPFFVDKESWNGP